MKKFLIMILIIISLSGCMQVTEFKVSDIDILINRLLKDKTSLINTSAKGYKYYLPTGVELVDSQDYNEKLYSNGDYYYLYVDLASYYYNEIFSYEEDSSLFYSKKLNYNKSGYLEIKKVDEEFYQIQFYYNYSKIEAYVAEYNLKEALINMCYILNSIKFNNSVSSVAIGDVNEQFDEENFTFYTPKKEGTFIEYITEYGNYNDETEDDGSNIGNEENVENE